MKKLLKSEQNEFIFIFSLLVIWRLVLYIVEYFSNYILLFPKFTGPIPWANFDGVHYLSIAQYGYHIYQQAFFPLFPLSIKLFTFFFNGNYVVSSVFIVYLSLFIALVFLYKLVLVDFNNEITRWTLVFFLFFPAGFFLGSVYTESLFLALTFSSFYFMRKQKFILASVLIGFASATKIIGIFLLIPLLLEFYFSNIKKLANLKHYVLSLVSIAVVSSSGLFVYMVYLWNTYDDPLLFIHTQPAFGAERSGYQIILLPQVIFRYIKILLSVSPLTHDFLVAVLELILFSIFLTTLVGFRKKIRLSYLVFSLSVIIVPTLTGTLSSIPRYLLVIFPVFILFSRIKKVKYKLLLLTSFLIILIILTGYFLRGYFIA